MPLANLTVGKYYCFQIGDWEKGLPMLALGQDETLKALAAQEIAGVTKADDQVKVGDAWWNLAEKEQGKVQAALRGRANYWYQQALPELSGLAKAKLEKRIKEYEAASEGTTRRPSRRRQSGRRNIFPAWLPNTTTTRAFMQMAKARVDATLDFDWGNESARPGHECPELSASAGWATSRRPRRAATSFTPAATTIAR